MKCGDVMMVWDYVNEIAVKESEMLPGSNRWAMSEKARWSNVAPTDSGYRMKIESVGLSQSDAASYALRLIGSMMQQAHTKGHSCGGELGNASGNWENLDAPNADKPETVASASEIEIVGRCVEVGDDGEGQPRMIIHTTREQLKRFGRNLAFADVAVTIAMTNGPNQGRRASDSKQ